MQPSRMRPLALAFTLMLAGFGAWAGSPRLAAPAFDHAVHLKLFPGSCTTCHLGAAETGAPFFPEAARCAACHDGVVQRRIAWAPPGTPPPSNLRFTHPRHRAATADSVRCVQCHALSDSGRTVVRREASRCIGCHLPGGEHLSAANDKCATCHLPLAEAKGLSKEAVADFPVPDSHLEPDFGPGGHGKLAETRGRDGGITIAPSCATCHARNFCANCHVNAPDLPAIRALALDDRSLVHAFTFAAPASHTAPGFIAVHGKEARRRTATCATCHSQSSCATCHAGATLPKPVMAMPQSGPGRAPGAQLKRHPPLSHIASFREGHGRQASASPRSCATCHTQADCLS
ncbi:MAG TPA: hypothetical protein VF187_02640, partial [Gemmatimonadales bacterium]